jgi:hypothetical protein
MGVRRSICAVYETACYFVSSTCKWQRHSQIAVEERCGACLYNEHKFPALHNSGHRLDWNVGARMY